MKKIIILLILIVACSDNDNSKPIDLMSENEMIDFLFDVNIINSSRAYNNRSDLNYYNINDSLLFNKHEIDCLKFINSNFYYSSNPKQYLKIYSKLDFRLNRLKDSLTNELNILTIKRKDSFN